MLTQGNNSNESFESTEGSPTSFQRFLQEELIRRCKKNPGYSLRSFTKTLQLNPGSLSRILRGERKISEEMRSRLGKRLGLTPAEIASLGLNSENTQTKLGKLPENQDFQQLSLETFRVISDWYHYAILEIVNLKHFKSEPRWVAKTLGITVSEVNLAVDRLVRLELLEIQKNGKWVLGKKSNTNVSQDLRDAAYRKLQQQVIEMALKALENIPVEYRDQSSMTMSVNTKRLPEAIERITKFRRELCAFMEQDKERDHVYQLGISLYPLTKFEN